ncbi:hypothetical protein [Kitasatospora sp. NPDC001175]|uniref:hypothetical protein n=1 Tax=Kitasatospora sp. NPDC001175 TaxID=3157103 RepID=UPI003D038326
MPRRSGRGRGAAPDAGAVSTFVAICAAGLVVVIGIVLDCGGRLREIENTDARAQEAARVVGQQLDQAAVLRGDGYPVIGAREHDLDVATRAADAYLDQYHLSADVTFKDDHTVQVSIDTTYRTALLGAINVNILPVHGQGTATLVHGVTEAENG